MSYRLLTVLGALFMTSSALADGYYCYLNDVSGDPDSGYLGYREVLPEKGKWQELFRKPTANGRFYKVEVAYNPVTIGTEEGVRFAIAISLDDPSAAAGDPAPLLSYASTDVGQSLDLLDGQSNLSVWCDPK